MHASLLSISVWQYKFSLKEKRNSSVETWGELKNSAENPWYHEKSRNEGWRKPRELRIDVYIL